MGADVNTLEFTAALFGVALAAGFLGSLTGLGGGVVITPALTLLLGVNLRYAIGASLVLPVIATSSGAAAAYVSEGYSNIRIGMFLEIATTTGARSALICPDAHFAPDAMIFGLVLFYSAFFPRAEQPQPDERARPPRRPPAPERLVPDTTGPRDYRVTACRRASD